MMNRFKKEEKIKYDEARKGLSKEQIDILDQKDKLDVKIDKLARKIHGDRFSEEFDFMYDSSLDASERAKGINPMNKEYIDEINKKRKDLGVSPLSENGMSISNDTFELCKKEATKIIIAG